VEADRRTAGGRERKVGDGWIGWVDNVGDGGFLLRVMSESDSKSR
jgi:hypothetical protein